MCSVAESTQGSRPRRPGTRIGDGDRWYPRSMLDGRWRAKVERGLEPVGHGLHRVGISADGLTIFGLAIAIVTAFVIADGHLVLGVIGLILTGRPRHPRRFGRSHEWPRRPPRSVLRLGLRPDRRRRDLPRCRLVPLRPRIRASPVLVMAVLALSMLITYERARAESLGLTARGGLMERAERMVLLGVGLAFDILVPVMWVMLVLTAFTAVQRFVKVWRQATPEHSRRPRHLRGGVGDEPRAGTLAQWWAARRPGHRPRGDRRDSATRRTLTVAPRGAYLAYRAGAEVARRVSRRRSASPWREGSRSSSASASCGARTRQVERNLRRIYGPRVRRRSRSDAPSPRPSTPTGVTSTSCSASRALRRRRSTRTCGSSGVEHIAAAIAAGRGVVLALPHLGNWDAAGAWLAGQGYTVTVVAEPLEPPELFDWFVDDASPARDACHPAVADCRQPKCSRALRANHVVCLLCDRDLTGDGIEVEFLGERTTLPAGPGDARAAQRRAARRGRVLLPARTARTRSASSTRSTPSGRGVSATTSHARHPGARAPLRAAHPRPAGALASDAAELAQRP